MNSYICKELDIADRTRQDENLRALCRGHTKMLGSKVTALHLWYPAHFSLDATPEHLMFENVAAAMSVQCYPLLRALLREFATYSCFRPAFRSPLVAAVAIGDDDMLKIALEHVAFMKTQNASLKLKDLQVESAIELAINERSTESIATIFKYIQAYQLKYTKELYQNSLKHALQLSANFDLAVVRCILQHCPGGQKVSPDTFLRACKSRRVELVRLLLAYMDVNTGTMLTLPLHQAIKTGIPAMIEAVLDAGADINNTHYVKNKSPYGKKIKAYVAGCPLEFAITQTFKAVQVLLKRGAIVPPVDRWHWPGRQRYIALRTARIAQTGEDIPTWEQREEQREKEPFVILGRFGSRE